MNAMQIAVQAVDALPVATTPFAAVPAPEQGQGFEKLLHDRRKAVADAGGNKPDAPLEAMFQGVPQGSEPALPALKEQGSPLAVLPTEGKAGDATVDQDTDLTQVLDPMGGAMQVVAAVTPVTAEAGAAVTERQPEAITAADREGAPAQPEKQQITARAVEDASGRVPVAETAVRQEKAEEKAPRHEAAPEGRGSEVQRPLVAAGDAGPRSEGAQQGAGLSADKAQPSPDVATAGEPSLAQPGNTAPAEPTGRTAAGVSVQQELADRLVVSKAELPGRQSAAVAAQQAPQGKDAQAVKQEMPAEALSQGGAPRSEGGVEEKWNAAQPATTGTAQPAASSIAEPATGQTAQPVDPAPQAAAAAIGGQERKPGQAKGEGLRHELRAAAEEPVQAAKGDAVTQERHVVQPQTGSNVGGDADHADDHAGAKDAPRKVVGIEGTGEVAASKAQQIEQPAQSQSTAKGTREGGALHRDVLAQVKQGTMVHDGKGNGTMSIRLNPGELGELKIQVHMEDNRFKVEVHAENRTVRDLLMNNLDSLKEALSGKDLAMEGFDVSTGGGDLLGRQAEQRESLRQQAMPKPMRLAGYEAVEERRFTYTTPAGGGLLDLRL